MQKALFSITFVFLVDILIGSSYIPCQILKLS